MSPKLTIFWTAAAVLLVGAPLPLLLRGGAAAESAEAATAATVALPLTVEFDGAPTSMRLYRNGELLAEMPAGTPSPWLLEPMIPASTAYEFELRAEWPQPGHSATLRAEPAGREAREQTRRAPLGELHDLFRLTW